LAELPTIAARRFGGKVALYSNEQALTFEAIEAHIACVASGLQRLGIRDGDRVVLHLPNTWRWVVAYYAIARIGAIVVPANILLVSEEIEFIARDCGAVAVIAPAHLIDGLRVLAGQASNLRYIAVGEGRA